MSRAEELFAVELALRNAAIAYAADKTNENRKALREAAIAYANEADDLDMLLDMLVHPDEPLALEPAIAPSVLDMPIASLLEGAPFSTVRLERCLENAELRIGVKVEYVGDLVQLTTDRLVRINNLGRVTIKQIRTLLAKHGLDLGMSISWERPS